MKTHGLFVPPYSFSQCAIQSYTEETGKNSKGLRERKYDDEELNLSHKEEE